MPKFTSRVFVNTLTAFGARICSLLIGFVVTPLLIHALGAEQFGLYAIVSSLTAYYGILDFGVGAGLVRYLTFYSERGEANAVKQVLTFGFLFYLILGIGLLPFVIWGAPFFPRLMHLQGPRFREAELLIVIMYISFILSSMAGLVTARLVSLHRMDIVSGGSLFAQIVYGAVLVLFVRRFPNLYFVIAAGFGQLGVSTLVACVMAKRLSSGFFCNPARIRPAFMRSLFRFGAWSQVCNLSAVINLEGDKLVLGNFLGVAEVVPYQVGNSAALLTRLLPVQFLTALLPDMTAAVSRGMTLAEKQVIYTDNTRRLMIVTLFVTGFLIAMADLFISVWIGRSLPLAATAAIALAISYSVNNLTGIGTVFMKAEGRPEYEAYYAVLSAGTNIVLTIILTRKYGFYGVVGGTIIGNCIGSLFFIVLFHRVTRFPWWATTGTWLIPLVVGVVAAITVTRLCLSAIPNDWAQNRILGGGLLAASALPYLATAIFVLALLRFWRVEDLYLLQAAGNWFGHLRVKPKLSSCERS
jgi:O-antigen/teichoic acid export membrane protein